MQFSERMVRLEGVGLWDATHYRVLGLFCVGVMISNFSAGMFAAMLTIFQSSFKFTAAEVGGLISINLASGALVSPFITWSVLRPVRLKLMGVGFIIAAAASVLGALSWNYTMLAFCQLGIGAGTTFVSVYGPPLLTVVAPAVSCTKYVGAFFLAVPIGNAIGLLVGGAMVQQDVLRQSWRYNFWIFAALSAAVGTVSLLFGHIRPHPNLTEGRKAPPKEHRTFLEQVRRVYRHPLFDLLIAAFGLAGFIIAAYGSFLPQFVQKVYRQNVQFASTLVGITIAPSVLIGIIVSSLVADWIVRGHSGTRKRFQLRAAFLVGVVSLGLPIVGIVFFMPKLSLFLVVLAIGLILVFCIPSPAVVAVLEILDASERTHGMGWVNFFYSSLGAIPGPLVLGKLLDVLWDRPRQAFAICGIAVLLIWVCIFIAFLLSMFVLSDRWFAVQEHAPHTHPDGDLDEIAEAVKEGEEPRDATSSSSDQL